MTLTKEKIVDAMRSKLGYDLKPAKELLELLLETMKDELESGRNVKISNFGKWSVKDKRSRMGRNPNTGDRLKLTARRVVTFSVSDNLRDKVNRSIEVKEAADNNPNA